MHPVSLSCCITFKNIEKLLFHWEFSTACLVHSYLSISKLFFFPIEHGTVPLPFGFPQYVYMLVP